ncbi:Fc.00g048290.m01.CDS01 [Cosmosporella sp. VM-42]
MTVEEKIALFRTGYTQNGSAHVQVYVADIPPKDDVNSLTLRGPIDIDTDDDSRPGGCEAATPVYDYQQQEIIWSCHGEHGDYEKNINLWRLGAHFSLSSIERTPLKALDSIAPSLILDNGKILVGAAEENDDDTQPIIITTIQRVLLDNKWTTVPFNTTSNAPVGGGILLFKPSREELKYFFYLWREPISSNVIHIDMVREDRFSKLSNNDSLRWQHFEVDFGFQISGRYTATVLHDNETDKSRLYIFKAHEYPYGISYAYIPLRRDGSIDSDRAKFQALGKQYLKAPVDSTPNMLKVLESGGRLILLLWDEYAGPVYHKLFGYSGTIKSDGSAPNGNEWTSISVNYEKKQVWADDARFSFSAVVIPSDFE